MMALSYRFHPGILYLSDIIKFMISINTDKARGGIVANISHELVYSKPICDMGKALLPYVIKLCSTR